MSYKRAVPSLVIGLGGVVIFSIGLIHVMKIGTCASGGPYVSARPCPSGTGGQILLLTAGAFAAVIGMIAGGFGGVGLLIWCALFLGSGTAMLVNSLTAHGLPSGAKSAGYIVGGIFIPMGGVPLIWLIAMGFRALRTRRLRARSKESDATISRVEQLQSVGSNLVKVRVTYGVQPLDNASFEVSRTTNVLATQMPHTGQRVRVRYDPADRDRFELITPSLASSVAAVTSGAQAGRVPAQAVASLAALAGAGAPGASGAPLSGASGMLGFPSTVIAPKRDPLDRLKELTELRDAGALTPSEFETQKAKILAET